MTHCTVNFIFFLTGFCNFVQVFLQIYRRSCCQPQTKHKPCCSGLKRFLVVSDLIQSSLVFGRPSLLVLLQLLQICLQIDDLLLKHTHTQADVSGVLRRTGAGVCDVSAVPEPAWAVWRARLWTVPASAAPCADPPPSSRPVYTAAARAPAAGSPPPASAPYHSAYTTPDTHTHTRVRLKLTDQTQKLSTLWLDEPWSNLWYKLTHLKIICISFLF